MTFSWYALLVMGCGFVVYIISYLKNIVNSKTAKKV